jgi:hypothetical protein
MMDVDLAKLGDKVDLSECPPPAAPIDPGKYFFINRMHYLCQQIFSGKINLFTENSSSRLGTL